MRRGLLGKGALLTITSEAARTSPVKRGKWFLETFLGVSPPDPPPGVETDLTPKEGDAPTTPAGADGSASHQPDLRLVPHDLRADGMALENFDAVGQWRTEDAGSPIDPTGFAPDGSRLEGVQSLRELTVRYGDQFAQVATEKLLTYAIGRGVEYEDMPLLRSITRNAAEDNYRFSSLVMGVIQSPAFIMNIKTAEITASNED